jgi:hypothetical protein
VTIAAVSFVPAAPLLVPELAGSSAGLDDDLRAASLDVTRRLHGAEEIVVAAPVDRPGSWGSDASWDFSGFGVPRRDGVETVLPWPLGIGAWLLDASGWQGARRYVGVHTDETSFPPLDQRVGLLVVGDGSARRTEKAPGYLDDRAEAFDDGIAAALAAGDPAALGAIDAGLAEELLCAGAPVWRWLSGVIGDQRPASADLVMHDARYGAGYFVAGWRFG